MDRVAAAELFVRVVDAGSFSEAARQLQRTPSAVSKAVAAFEDHLGVRLLQRTTRKLSLTGEGRQFYERCRAAIGELEEAERAVRDSADAPRGLLRVTAPVTFCHYQLAGLLPDFLARYPGIRLDLDVTDRLVDLVEEGIDVGIRLGGSADDGLIRRRLADNHRLLCASPAYLARHGTPERPEDLAGHNCLAFSAHDTLNDWPFMVPEGRVLRRFDGNVLANNGETLLALALQGVGIARLSAFMAAGAIGDGRLVEVLPNFVRDTSPTIYVLYPSRRHLSAKVRAFVDTLVTAFQPTPPWARPR